MSDPLVRWGGTRAVACLTVEIVFVLLLVVGVPLLAFRASGSGAGAVNVEVCDEAGVLQGDATVSALEKLHFRTITTLVVVTLDTGSGSDFDTAVLAYAREKHPEWISSSHYHPTRWADGLVILGLSPSGRKVGTYFGEDVKVSYSRQQEIQAAGKDSFRDQQWETGIEQMARSASDIVDHSDRRKGEKLLFSGIGIAGGLTLTFFMIRGRSRARAAYSRALDHYTRVTAGYGSTRAKAGLIPSGEAHGAQVLARFAWFEDHYAGLIRAFQKFGEPRGAAWFFRERREDAEDLDAQIGGLESLEETISHASDLLTMSAGWREAWRNEQGPVQEDLASFERLCLAIRQTRGDMDVEQERTWRVHCSGRLAAMADELASGALSPAKALDELDAISRAVRMRTDALARRALEADRSSYRDRRLGRYESSQGGRGWSKSNSYMGRWVDNGRIVTYNPASTIRITPSSPGTRACGAQRAGTGLFLQFSTPVSSLVAGYSSAVTWSPSSNIRNRRGGFFPGDTGLFMGGDVSGGGGFDGAGSSSSF